VGENFILIQDNACAHTARYTTDFLRRNDIIALDYLPLSSDQSQSNKFGTLLIERFFQSAPKFTGIGLFNKSSVKFHKTYTSQSNNSTYCQMICRKDGDTRF